MHFEAVHTLKIESGQLRQRAQLPWLAFFHLPQGAKRQAHVSQERVDQDARHEGFLAPSGKALPPLRPSDDSVEEETHLLDRRVSTRQ